MEVSPFPFHGPLEPEQVRGREELVDDLVVRLTQRRVTALIGPRRYGKTSVLRRVAAELAEASTSVVWVDLYEVASHADLAMRLDEALHGSAGPIRSRLARIAATADLNLGMLKLSFARRRDERPDAVATLHVLLDALVAAASDHPTVVVFDEFPGITRVDGAAGLLRTKLQHHYQDLGIVFAGSQPTLMRALFTESTMPFYAQADLVAIGPLELAALTAIVEEGFESTGRDPGRAAALVHDLTGGHPQRSMQLADAVWRQAPVGHRWHDRTWEAALADVRTSTELANEAVFAGFSSSEKLVLRLVASGGGLFGAAAELLSLSHGQAQHARDKLLASGDLIDAERSLRVVDPLLADWLRRRLPA